MNAYFTKAQYLHRILILIDSEHGLKSVDKMLLELIEKR